MSQRQPVCKQKARQPRHPPGSSWRLVIARLLPALVLLQCIPALVQTVQGATGVGGSHQRLGSKPNTSIGAWQSISQPAASAQIPASVEPDAAPAAGPSTSTPEPSPSLPSPELVGYGFGGRATGGKGHPVVEVTNLRDSGERGAPIPGSLRAALSGGNRIVRFRVSGSIQLADQLNIRYPNVTIDGSDAPNGGVALWGHTLNVESDNVVIRHLRFRGSHPTASVDGIAIGGGSDILIDHVSCSWATDECLDIYGYSYVGKGHVRNVTVQNSLFAEAPEGDHSSATLVSGNVSQVTWFRNVFAKNANRNPQITTGHQSGPDRKLGELMSGIAEYELIQNVIYDAVYGTRIWNQSPDWTIHIDAIGNLWKPGPRWPSPKVPIMVFAREKSLGPIRVFMNGNAGPRRTARNPKACDFFSLEAMNTPCGGYESRHEASQRLITRHAYPATTASAELETILGGVGAMLPRRDSFDRKIVEEVRTGTGRHVKGPGKLPDLNRAWGDSSPAEPGASR